MSMLPYLDHIKQALVLELTQAHTTYLFVEKWIATHISKRTPLDSLEPAYAIDSIIQLGCISHQPVLGCVPWWPYNQGSALCIMSQFKYEWIILHQQTSVRSSVSMIMHPVKLSSEWGTVIWVLKEDTVLQNRHVHGNIQYDYLIKY